MPRALEALSTAAAEREAGAAATVERKQIEVSQSQRKPASGKPAKHLARYPANAAITNVATDKPGVIEIVWSDDHVSKFHASWLRDNCSCPLCRHPDTLERIADPFSTPAEIGVSEVRSGHGGDLEIIWEDAHRAVYEPGWLRAHCYADAARDQRREAVEPTIWGPGLRSILPVFESADVMSDDGVLLQWLESLCKVGVAIVRNVPTKHHEIVSIVQRISHLRRTNFGSVFDVIPKIRPNSNAYTSLAMPLHTDLPQYELAAGYQFFHCLANSVNGGESVLVDGLNIAETLRREDPQAFEMLTRWPVHFRFQDDDSDLSHWGQLIKLDEAGNVAEIRFSQSLTAPLDVPFDQMEAMRRAYQSFYAMTCAPRFQATLRLQPGDLLVNDNRRILHARTSFDSHTGERHLQGCYVDKSEMMSRIRVLRRNLHAANQPAYCYLSATRFDFGQVP